MSTVNPTATPDIGTSRDGLWCESCSHEVPEAEAVALYECGSCGESTTERRCEQCNKFKARSEDVACPECEEKLVEEQLTTDYDGETILATDFVEGGTSYADRAEAEREAAAKERAEKAAIEKAQRESNSRQITWGDLTVGDVVIKPGQLQSWESPFMTVGYLNRTPDGRVIASLYEFGWRTHVMDAQTLATVSTDEQVIAAERDDVEPYAVLERKPDGDVPITSSPTKKLAIELGHAAKDGGLLPVMQLVTTGGGMRGMLMVAADPEIATRTLDALEQAAIDLAATLGVAPDPTAADVEVDPDNGWCSSDLHLSGRIEVGADTWNSDHAPVLNVVTTSTMTFRDPNIVLAAVTEARRHLGHLTLAPKQVGR